MPIAEMIAEFLRHAVSLSEYGYFIAVIPLDTDGIAGVQGVFSENVNPPFLSQTLRLFADRIDDGTMYGPLPTDQGEPN